MELSFRISKSSCLLTGKYLYFGCFPWQISSEPKLCTQTFLWVKVRKCFWGGVWMTEQVRAKPGALAEGHSLHCASSGHLVSWIRAESGVTRDRRSCLAKRYSYYGLSVVWKNFGENFMMANNVKFLSEDGWVVADVYCWEKHVFVKTSWHCGVPHCISQKTNCSLYPTLVFTCVEFSV